MSHAATKNSSLVFVISGCLSAASVVAMGAESPALTAADEAAARKVIAEFANSWNSHDMTAMHELNTDDVEWINVSGNHWRGNTDVRKGHDFIHRTIFAKTDMSIENTKVRPLTSDVAVVVATMKFGPHIAPSGEKVSELRTRATFVLLKRQGIWKATHFQNTILDPKADDIDPLNLGAEPIKSKQ